MTPVPIAYRNGEFVPQDQLAVPPQDIGFTWGVTVAEQLRTFRGKLFQLPEHLDRLRVSLQIVGVEVDLAAIENAAQQVVEHNFALVDANSDLGLTIFVTPGLSATYCPDTDPQPLIGVHSYPLPFSLWQSKYEDGQNCELSRVTQVSKRSWPRHLKARSRIHYFLADKQARERNPKARAILLDEKGNVNEASTANVVAYFEDEGFVSPPLENILAGISLLYVESLVRESGQPFTYRDLTAKELTDADEILLTSTPFCVLPVSQLEDQKLTQRSQFNQLLVNWSQAVKVDIRNQSCS